MLFVTAVFTFMGLNSISKYGNLKINHKYSCHLLNSTNMVAPKSFKSLSKDIIIGHGMSDFVKANDILFNFKMINSLPWIKFYLKQGSALNTNLRLKLNSKFNSHKNIHPNVGILVNCYKVLWVLNPGRIVSVQDSTKNNNLLSSNFILSTLQGHLLSGEEKFEIIKLPNNVIKFEITSFSKGSGLLGTVALPFIRPLQKRFMHQSTQRMRSLMNEE
eukprot:gene2915-5727_t